MGHFWAFLWLHITQWNISNSGYCRAERASQVTVDLCREVKPRHEGLLSSVPALDTMREDVKWCSRRKTVVDRPTHESLIHTSVGKNGLFLTRCVLWFSRFLNGQTSWDPFQKLPELCLSSFGGWQYLRYGDLLRVLHHTEVNFSVRCARVNFIVQL